MTRRARHGFSLLEVLLATAIMIGSAIVLMELVSIGSRHASAARDLARSQLICESRLNEILAHVERLESSRPTPFEDDPQWVVWVDLRPLPQSGFVALEVNAAREPNPHKQSARFKLVRWVRDPQSRDINGSESNSAGAASMLTDSQRGPRP
jgi:type II secretory pathway component PulJ